MKKCSSRSLIRLSGYLTSLSTVFPVDGENGWSTSGYMQKFHGKLREKFALNFKTTIPIEVLVKYVTREMWEKRESNLTVAICIGSNSKASHDRQALRIVNAGRNGFLLIEVNDSGCTPLEQDFENMNRSNQSPRLQAFGNCLDGIPAEKKFFVTRKTILFLANEVASEVLSPQAVLRTCNATKGHLGKMRSLLLITACMRYLPSKWENQRKFNVCVFCREHPLYRADVTLSLLLPAVNFSDKEFLQDTFEETLLILEEVEEILALTPQPPRDSRWEEESDSESWKSAFSSLSKIRESSSASSTSSKSHRRKSEAGSDSDLSLLLQRKDSSQESLGSVDRLRFSPKLGRSVSPTPLYMLQQALIKANGEMLDFREKAEIRTEAEDLHQLFSRSKTLEASYSPKKSHGRYSGLNPEAPEFASSEKKLSAKSDSTSMNPPKLFRETPPHQRFQPPFHLPVLSTQENISQYPVAYQRYPVEFDMHSQEYRGSLNQHPVPYQRYPAESDMYNQQHQYYPQQHIPVDYSTPYNNFSGENLTDHGFPPAQHNYMIPSYELNQPYVQNPQQSFSADTLSTQPYSPNLYLPLYHGFLPQSDGHHYPASYHP